MSWLAGRTTERLEDRAYCVLGIFDIYLYARYGSGEDEFMRLQEEIVKGWRKNVPFDDSLFAWRAEQIESSGIFAPAPGYFRHAGNIMFIPELAKHRGQEMRVAQKSWIPGMGMEIDNAGQMTLAVPCLGFIPGAMVVWMLTFTSAFLITTVPAMMYQKLRQHRDVRLNCWTKGADGKLCAKEIKMEFADDKRWHRIDCGKLYDSSSTKLYPSGWISNRFCVKLNLTRETKYKS